MQLTAGTRLDGYEILGPLGAGGMGEVYRARDPILKREVAIKVLPPSVSQDADRLRRFEQEAQAAAALNHPNILAIHHFGVFNGAPYLISELLLGDTLRQLLQRGPLPIRKTIDYAVHFAHGLAAAHEKGIVHRDLKPENLFVTKDGRLKILDFGLAKLTQPQSGSESDGQPNDPAPTLTHSTEPGVVLGTMGYMSPEQVRGRPADYRADIFAFGAILYEMLAGKRAFARSTSADTMAAILNEDPPAISQIVQTTPLGLQRVVHRCLEKNPEQRFQSASDLAFALEALSESGISSGPSITPPAAHKPRRILAWSAGFLAIVALAAATYYFLIRKQHVPFEHYSIQKVMDSRHVRMTAISPDGSYLASVIQDESGGQALWLHHIPTNSERPILQDAAYKYIDIRFSPDGGYIYFRIDALGAPDREDVYRVAVLGGTAARILEGVNQQLTFIEGGQRVCFHRDDVAVGTEKFFSASAEGGDEQPLAQIGKPLPYLAVCGPNGKFAITESAKGLIETRDFASGSKKTIASYDTLGNGVLTWQWAPDGKGLFAITTKIGGREGQIGFISYPGGKLRAITSDLGNYSGLSITSDASIIATTQREENESFDELSLKDPTHIEHHPADGLFHFAWLDYNRIVFADQQKRLKVIDLKSNAATTLSSATDRQYYDEARCDADTVVATGTVTGKASFGIYRMRLDGGGVTELTNGPADWDPQCSPDGKWLYYADTRTLNHSILTRQPLQGGKSERIIDSSMSFDISADSKLLATAAYGEVVPLQIISMDSLNEIKSFPPLKNGACLAFSTDGTSVFEDSYSGAGTTIWRQPLDSRNKVKVVAMPGKFLRWCRPSPDGTRLGLAVVSPTSEAVLIRDKD